MNGARDATTASFFALPQAAALIGSLLVRYFAPALFLNFPRSNPSICRCALASAFAYVHVIFRNRLAVPLTFVAGLLFALRYLQTNSLFVAALEHALYGCAIFTVGLGNSFFHGSRRRSVAGLRPLPSI